jgi:hypothetical protein
MGNDMQGAFMRGIRPIRDLVGLTALREEWFPHR